MRRIRIWSELQKPRYTHDCDTCIFLGHFNQFDLYACGEKLPEMDLKKNPDFKDMRVTTVLARRSSQPSDYSSGLEFAFHSHKDVMNPLRQAAARVMYMSHRFIIADEMKETAWRHIIEPMYKGFVTES